MMGTYIFRTAVAVLLLFITQPAQAGAGSVTDDGRIRGSADAPITLIEYSDFTCGYCAKFFWKPYLDCRLNISIQAKCGLCIATILERIGGRSRRCGRGALCRSPGSILADARSTLQ